MNGRLTLESLRYADAVADAGSFSSAARRFGVTQPALSSSIAKLEDHLGGRLFLRNPRGTSATAFGDAVLPRIHQAVTDVDRIESEAEAFTTAGQGTIRIGTSPQIEKGLVTRLRSTIYGPDPLSPGRDATLLETELDQLEEYLQVGVLDMIIVPALGLLPTYSHHLLNADFLVLVDDAGGSDPIPVAELAERELILSRNGCGITRSVESLFAEDGLTVKHSEVEVANCSTLLSWVDKGMGSVVLPERNVPEGVPVRRIVREDGTYAEMFNEMVWDPGSADSLYFAALADRLAD
ncbi:LysR family transcriptional regulator [Corynebacterium nuruki]|uniref:LysR family transcriptional regulator n=1 Tax=Corynebacterium nuruki TaxID=1032851 RepID=UPI0039BF5713